MKTRFKIWFRNFWYNYSFEVKFIGLIILIVAVFIVWVYGCFYFIGKIDKKW